MWIILVNKDLQEIRNNVLTELLNNEKSKESYLNYRYGRFSHSGFLPDAKVYKTKSGAESGNPVKDCTDIRINYFSLTSP